MKNDWLDKQLKDGLSDYSSQADFEGLWGKVEQKRKKKDRRWLFLLLFFGLGLAAAGGSWYWRKAPQSAVTSEQSFALAPTIAADAQTPNTSAETETQAAAHTKSTTATLPQAPVKSVDQTSHVEPSSPFISTKKKKENPVLKPQAPIEQNEMTESNGTRLTDTPVKQKQTTVQPSVTQQAIGLTQQVQSKIITAEATEREELHFGLVEPIKPTTGHRLWLSLDLHYGLQDQNRTAIDPENTDYLARTNAAASSIDARGIQLGVKKYFSRRFFLQTGLGYTLLTNRFQDRYANSFSEVLDDQLLKVIYRSNGTSEEVLGPQAVTINRQRIKTVYNRSHFIQIPVLVGADFHLNQRLGLTLAAGLNYTHLLKQRGGGFDLSLLQGEYRDLSEEDYDSRNLWQAQAQGQLFYRLRPSLRLTAGLQAQLSLNKLEAAELGWQERWNIGTLSLGLQWQLR